MCHQGKMSKRTWIRESQWMLRKNEIINVMFSGRDKMKRWDGTEDRCGDRQTKRRLAEKQQRKRWMTRQREGEDRTELMKECTHKGHTNNRRWLQWQRITVIDLREQEKFRFHKQLCWTLMSHVNTIKLRRIQIGSIQRDKVSEGKQTRDLVCGTGNINKEPY